MGGVGVVNGLSALINKQTNKLYCTVQAVIIVQCASITLRHRYDLMIVQYKLTLEDWDARGHT